MESKSIEEYFSKARQIPVTVSLTEIKSMISAKGVTSPPKKSWWNMNNIIIMTTATIITTTTLWISLLNTSTAESKYAPLEHSFTAKEIVEFQTEKSMKFVVEKRDSTEDKNQASKNLFSNVPNQATSKQDDQTGLLKTPALTALEQENARTQEGLLDIEIESGLVEAPSLFEEKNEPQIKESVDEQFFDENVNAEETELFETENELTEEVKGKTKEVTKTIDINELNTLFLKHKNGNITVNTWDEPKIKATAYFTLETKDEEDADLGFDDFDIVITAQGNKAVLESNWDELNNCSCNTNGNTNALKGIGKIFYFSSKNKAKTDEGIEFKYEKFKIEYVIFIPKDFHVDLKNNYADISLSSINGNANLKLFHGDLDAKDLGDLTLVSKYGKAELGNVKDADLSLFHSDTKLGTSQEMDLSTKYSTVEIGGLNELNVDGFQSKLKVEGSIQEDLEGSFKYGNLTVEGDIKKVELLMFQSRLQTENIGKLNLNASYSKLKAKNVGNLELEKAFQTSFRIEELVNVEGVLRYSPMHIGSLTKSLDLTTFQGVLEVKEIKADFESMSLDTKFTNIDLNFSPSAKYKLDAETMYTDLKLPSGITNTVEKQNSNRNGGHFVGTFNEQSNKSASKVFMKSFQGNVTLY